MAATLAHLLDTADERSPWQPDDSKSGARFERVVIAGQTHVLKYQDPRDDWLLRAAGDPGHRYVVLWDSGLLGRLPPVIDHAVVAAAYDGSVGMVLLRDVSGQLLEPGRAFDPEQHQRYLRHMASMHATLWDWRTTLGSRPWTLGICCSPRAWRRRKRRGDRRPWCPR